MKKAYLKPTLLLFFFMAGAGAIEPNLSVILREKGIAIDQIGLLTLMPRAMTLLAGPAWALVSDVFRLEKFVLPLAMALSIPFLVAFNLPLPYIVILILTVLFSVNYAPVRALCDAVVMDLLDEDDHKYGTLRALGAMGYALATLLIGQLASDADTSIAIWVFALFFAVGAGVAIHLPAPPPIQPIPVSEAARIVSKDKRWIGLLSGALLAGFGTTALINYFVLFLKDLGANTQEISLAILSGSLGAIPMFFLTPMLIKKFSAKRLIQFSFLALAVRLSLYTITTSPFSAAIIQLMHGLTFSTFWSAGVLIANRISPIGFSASGQALFSGMYFGLGGMAGTFMGGLIYSQWGINSMFLSGALSALFGWIVFNYFMSGEAFKQT